VTLTVIDVPSGVTARVDPQTVSPGQAATLSFSAAPGANAGRGQGYAVVAVAADGTVASTSGTLDVVDADFTLGLETQDAQVTAGATTRVKVLTTPRFGTPEKIVLSVTGLGPGMTAAFDPRIIVAGETSILALTGASVLPPSGSSLIVTADATSTSHRATLHVRALGAPLDDPPVKAVTANAGGCGCSAGGGGWEALGFSVLLLATRRRRR
jgi:MYXO-CTERM domain-containing protein